MIDARTRHPRRQRIRSYSDRVLIEVAFIRDFRSAVWFFKWLARGVLIRTGALLRPTRPSKGRPVASAAQSSLPPRAQSLLPAEVAAIGPRAEAIFGSAGGRYSPVEPHVDVVVADNPEVAHEVKHPTVVLSANPRLAVPVLDHRLYNPIGWRRRVEDRVAALGPLDQLPRHVHAGYVLASTNLDLIRHCHHLEDVRAFHANATERAGTIVRLAAAGAVIHVADKDPELESLLGNELYGLVATDIGGADIAQRELHSVRMRRIALRDHSLNSRVRQICATVFKSPPQPQGVSVLLATNRPKFLNDAIANVAKQNYPRLQLILALHGDEFDNTAVECSIANLTCDVETVPVSATRPFPAVLNAATAAADGEVLTKMDDDDVYDTDHVWDLMLAREYAAAHLVGKGVETVYLARRDQTIERDGSAAETYSRGIAGGTLLISRADLEGIGGWRGVPPYVDKTLIDDVVGHGGTTYRTHGRGYVLVRHGEKHSWNVADQHFVDSALAVHRGWCASVAGFAPPPIQLDFN